MRFRAIYTLQLLAIQMLHGANVNAPVNPTGPRVEHDATLNGITILIPHKGSGYDSDDGALKVKLENDKAYESLFRKEVTKLMYNTPIVRSVEETKNTIGIYVLTSNGLIDPYYTAGMLAFDQSSGVKEKIETLTPSKVGVILAAHANSHTIGGYSVSELVPKLMTILPAGTYPELSLIACRVDGNSEKFKEVAYEDENGKAIYTTDLLEIYDHEPVGKELLVSLKSKGFDFGMVWMSHYPVFLGDKTNPLMTLADEASLKYFLHDQWRKKQTPELAPLHQNQIARMIVGGRSPSIILATPKKLESSVGVENEEMTDTTLDFILASLLFFFVIIVFIYKNCFKLNEADISTPLLLV